MKIEANLPAEVETRAIRLKETLGCTYSQLIIQGINKLALEYLVFNNATHLKDHGGDYSKSAAISGIGHRDPNRLGG